MQTHLSPGTRRSGFTIVEFMIATAAVALLMSLAIPGYQVARRTGQSAALMNELRTTEQAFLMFLAENGNFPPTTETFQTVPDGMDVYMPKNNTWTGTPKIGGYWVFLNLPMQIWGRTAFIGIFDINADPDQIRKIDERIDDGNPSSGALRYTSNWLLYSLN